MTMQAALMVPCYIDMFYPRVGIATVELLEKLGADVVYPKDQTCCGQPMANSRCYEEARATEEHCARVFGSFNCVVTPSGSCTHHIRNKFTAAADSPEKQNLVRNTYDLVEFLHDVLKIREFPWATFEHKVALHTSCSAIRGLNMASSSSASTSVVALAAPLRSPKRQSPQRWDTTNWLSCRRGPRQTALSPPTCLAWCTCKGARAGKSKIFPSITSQKY